MDIKMQEIYILFCDTELYKVFTNYATAQKCLVDLNENRIKTLKNTKWYAATLSHLLRKKIYIGTLERGHVSKNGNTYEIKNNHQPI